MKAKIRTNKIDNTMVCEYYNTKKPFEFRYKILSKIVNNYDNIVMFIDTNSRTKMPDFRVEAYFDENGMEYSMFKIPQTEKKILGMVVSLVRKPKTKLIEKFIIAKINKNVFTEEFYNRYLSTYDIALGINSKLSIDQMVREYRENITEIYFKDEYFEEFIYDSIMFASMRTTLDIVMECEG